jgi:hypothetical protein
MQRVLFEILRRSHDNDRYSRKRKVEPESREDGKYAEELFRRETRGARPGRDAWLAKRRKMEKEDFGRRMSKMESE